MYFNENKDAHTIYMHTAYLTVFSTPYILTQCLTRLDRHRKSTQNTESTLWLAKTSNLQSWGFETSNEKNNL